MPPCLYIISGASGCGKTTLLNSIAALNVETVDSSTKAIRAIKYSERMIRNLPGEIDDITHVDDIKLGEYDIAYVINNKKYGIKVGPIIDLIDRGYNPFIVLSDFRVIRQMKEIFGQNVKSLYVSSAIDSDKLRRIQMERQGFRPTDEQKNILAYHFARASAAARLGWWDRVTSCMYELESDWHAYATDAKSTEIRTQKIRAFHIRYIEHISLFDHVILNYSENRPDEMTSQVLNLLTRYSSSTKARIKMFPPIFIVAAASGAGKGTLMEMLNFIGRDKVRIVSKLAKRKSNNGDKRDGMIALLRSPADSVPEWPAWWSTEMKDIALNGEFPREYDIRWTFHKTHGSQKGGTPYAVSSIEIQRNLEDGVPQIFVSNMSQYRVFQERWPNNAVLLYLHRLVSAHDYREFQVQKWKSDSAQAEARISERESVHSSYIDQISEVDHVLLNTANEEDLYDQMFRLLEYYKSIPANSKQTEDSSPK